MPIDIYTKKQITTYSREHVIPDFLGGNLSSRDLMDRTTNSEFGIGIDAALSRALQPFRVLIDARSQTKATREAPPIRGVEDADGEQYTVKAGGIIQVRPSINVQEKDNEVRITGRIASQGELRQALRKIAKRKKWDLDRLVEEIMKDSEEARAVSPRLTLSVNLWDTDPYRATAKIACNFLALHNRSLFLQDEFDMIRDFVVAGTSLTVAPVQAVEVNVGPGMGTLDHLLSIEANEDGEILGLVVYFARLAFLVHMGTVSHVTPFKHSYRVDQIGRKHRRDHEADLAITSPSFHVATARSHEEFRATVLEQSRSLWSEVREIQRGLWLNRMLRPHWEQLGTAKTLTEEAITRFARDVAQDLIKELEPRIEAAARERQAAAERAVIGDREMTLDDAEPDNDDT